MSLREQSFVAAYGGPCRGKGASAAQAAEYRARVSGALFLQASRLLQKPAVRDAIARTAPGLLAEDAATDRAVAARRGGSSSPVAKTREQGFLRSRLKRGPYKSARARPGAFLEAAGRRGRAH